MAVAPTIVLKNYLRDKLLESKLLFTRESNQITDFFRQINDLSKILIIVPHDRAEEVFVRKYLSQIRSIFKGTRISTLDVFNMRDYDTNWIGMPNQNYLKKLHDEKFEFVIDLNSHHDQLCTYLCLCTTAPLRLHLVQGKYDKIYNLQLRVADSTSTDNLFRNLISYLSLLRGVKVDTNIPA